MAAACFAFEIESSVPSFTAEHYLLATLAIASSSDIGTDTDWLRTIDLLRVSSDLPTPRCSCCLAGWRSRSDDSARFSTLEQPVKRAGSCLAGTKPVDSRSILPDPHQKHSNGRIARCVVKEAGRTPRAASQTRARENWRRNFEVAGSGRH